MINKNKLDLPAGRVIVAALEAMPAKFVGLFMANISREDNHKPNIDNRGYCKIFKNKQQVLLPPAVNSLVDS